jgi:hypothetical protein
MRSDIPIMWKTILTLFALVAIVASTNRTDSSFPKPTPQEDCRADWRPRCGNGCAHWIHDIDFDYARRSYLATRARRRARRLAAAWMWAWM